MARGGHGLPKVSPGPAMLDPSAPCERATPQTALWPLQRWPSCKAGSLQPSSTLLDTPRRIPMRLSLPLSDSSQIFEQLANQEEEQMTLGAIEGQTSDDPWLFDSFLKLLTINQTLIEMFSSYLRLMSSLGTSPRTRSSIKSASDGRIMVLPHVSWGHHKHRGAIPNIVVPFHILWCYLKYRGATPSILLSLQAPCCYPKRHVANSSFILSPPVLCCHSKCHAVTLMLPPQVSCCHSKCHSVPLSAILLPQVSFKLHPCIGIQCGVSKCVEDGRRLPALQAGHHQNNHKAFSGVAGQQGIEG
jgi:hypothetical protein